MKTIKSTLILACGLLVCAFTATASAARDDLTEKVTAVAEGQVITLSSTGPAMFADLVFPDAEMADAWFATHLLQHELSFKVTGSDRYGRRIIQSDAQEAMLRDGVAVIYSFDGAPKNWQALEDNARIAKKGVWAQPSFVLTPENAAQHIGAFHVVEGVITRIYEAKSATYINFGADWHRDFSVTIPGKFRRGFKEMLPQLKAGVRVRVRGSIYEENGPMIRITKPEHVEMIEASDLPRPLKLPPSLRNLR
jgi:hypothetical protein